MDAIFLHDPTTFLAVIMPELFTWRAGAIRVLTSGIAMGQTIADASIRNWNSPHAWDNRPPVHLAVDVRTEDVQRILYERFCA